MNRLLLGALLALAACAHAPAKNEKSAPKAAAPSKRVAPVTDDGIALAITPAGLLTDDGPHLIQNALHDKGYLEQKSGKLDAPTSDAIRKFQKEHSLARTGNPDTETVKKLGLDPKAVFKKAD